MLYDCFTFFNELEILDIRLHEMAPSVDRFVLVEARKTFQGAEKPLYFEENKALFTPFLDKIEHIIVDFPSDIDHYRNAKSPAWAREYFQRDQIAQGLKTARSDDLVLISDVDEIVKSQILQQARTTLRKGQLGVFTGFSYAHYLGQIWQLGPRLCHFTDFRSAQTIRNIKLHASRSLQNTRLGAWHTRLKNWIDCDFSGPLNEYENAIWHFTSIGGWDRFRAKIDAFAHEEERNNLTYQSEAAFLDHISTSSHRVGFEDLPQVITANRSRFAKHLDLPVSERIAS